MSGPDPPPAAESRHALRGGSEVRIRPIRAEDHEPLAEGVERMSPDSRYLRFLTPLKRLDDRALDYLTDIDHSSHEALVAIDPATRDGIGVARYVRAADRPGSAEVAVAVADAWQRRGLGALLLELLARRARQEGIERLTALVLEANPGSLALLETLGPTEIVRHGDGTALVEVPLAPHR